MGGTDKNLRTSDFPWIGGAGYAVSRQLIEEKVLLRCPEIQATGEDKLTSRCLFANGVNFTDTRDAKGKYRFCRNAPGKSCDYEVGVAPSDEVVLFHYVYGPVRNELALQYYGQILKQE